jgi:hypothetical protein
MHIIGAVDLAGLLNVSICGEGLFDEATHLLFVVGVTFDGINDQAMG